MQYTTPIAAVLLGLSLAGTALAQQPKASVKRRSSASQTQAALRAQAKISADSARAVALAVVPTGTVQSSELEREHGKLIYSFDIKVPNTSGIDEVNVDAITGKVIAHQHESPSAERREARQEAREKARSTRKDSVHKS